MPELLAALDAFPQEHRRCGELEGGVGADIVWMSCDLGTMMTRSLVDCRHGGREGDERGLPVTRLKRPVHSKT